MERLHDEARETSGINLALSVISDTSLRKSVTNGTSWSR
jgi:hypothetical protein